jgi:hypothetical protein
MSTGALDHQWWADPPSEPKNTAYGPFAPVGPMDTVVQHARTLASGRRERPMAQVLSLGTAASLTRGTLTRLRNEAQALLSVDRHK